MTMMKCPRKRKSLFKLRTNKHHTAKIIFDGQTIPQAITDLRWRVSEKSQETILHIQLVLLNISIMCDFRFNFKPRCGSWQKKTAARRETAAIKLWIIVLFSPFFCRSLLQIVATLQKRPRTMNYTLSHGWFSPSLQHYLSSSWPSATHWSSISYTGQCLAAKVKCSCSAEYGFSAPHRGKFNLEPLNKREVLFPASNDEACREV